MRIKRPLPFAVILLAALAFLGCASAARQPQPEPTIVATTRTEGRGTPRGSSSDGPYLQLSETASSPTYGYTQSMPILVSFEGPENGPQNSRRYLNSLRGPKGEVIEYERRGSCCPFETGHSELGAGMLDVYELTYAGLAKPIVLYINMYDPGEPLIPQGLTARR